MVSRQFNENNNSTKIGCFSDDQRFKTIAQKDLKDPSKQESVSQTDWVMSSSTILVACLGMHVSKRPVGTLLQVLKMASQSAALSGIDVYFRKPSLPSINKFSQSYLDQENTLDAPKE
ncbi:hypothetical protein ILYODFUR_032791 [Ilyodon furcidens]|uniref:Uncharacterized protein n=1 Tax=Ilyodon furcidens TaxID=33524 RepID=A0ABV0TZS8_9TELE